MTANHDRVPVLKTSGKPGQHFTVRRDRKNSSRIYMEGPKFCVLDETAAIDLCNRITDLIEEGDDD